MNEVMRFLIRWAGVYLTPQTEVKFKREAAVLKTRTGYAAESHRGTIKLTALRARPRENA